MKKTPDIGRQIAQGSLWIFLGEALAVPSGFIVAIFLTSRLGLAGYGAFALCVALISWIEWTLIALFSRSVVRWIAQTEDWKPFASGILRLVFLLSSGAALAVFFLADWAAQILNAPETASYFRLLALDIPLFTLAVLSRNILIGRGHFGRRAALGALRWLVRPCLIVLFVQLGGSIPGAIAGSIGASLLEMFVSANFLKIPFMAKISLPWKEFFLTSAPFFFFSLIFRLFNKLDLFMLQALAANLNAAGIYALAENVTILSGLFSMSTAPLILAELSRAENRNEAAEVKRISTRAVQTAIFLFPFAVIVSRTAEDLVRLFFHTEFLSAAPLISILVFAGWAMILIAMCASILSALERPFWTYVLAFPLLPLAAAGHLILIPRMGAQGAALVTLMCSIFCALAGLFLIHWRLKIPLPWASIFRSAGIGLVIYILTGFWRG